MLSLFRPLFFFFFFNDTATTEIYTLSLHDALPILIIAPLDESIRRGGIVKVRLGLSGGPMRFAKFGAHGDRKSTRLNSSHGYISYAVFCLKKKKHTQEGVRAKAGRCDPAPGRICDV